MGHICNSMGNIKVLINSLNPKQLIIQVSLEKTCMPGRHFVVNKNIKWTFSRFTRRALTGKRVMIIKLCCILQLGRNPITPRGAQIILKSALLMKSETFRHLDLQVRRYKSIVGHLHLYAAILAASRLKQVIPLKKDCLSMIKIKFCPISKIFFILISRFCHNFLDF